MKIWAVWGVVGAVVAGGFVTSVEAQVKAKVAKVPSAPAVSATEAVPSVGNEKSARVMLLDKQTNRRQTLVLIAGTAQTVGTVNVNLTKCLPDYGAVLGQDVAWLDVTESADGSGRSSPWFSGWMFNTFPEISTLDHPRYEVQLLGCGVKARQIIKASGSAPIMDATPPEDTESNDDASTTSSDPYYVPGVEKVTAPVATPAVAAPVDEEAPADTETPAAAVVPAVEAMPPAAPAGGEQQDLHRMMDSGQY